MTLPSSRRIAGAALLAALALPACSEQPAGRFSASLEGPVEGTFQGKATFCRRSDRGDFLLVLQPSGTTAGFVLGRDTAALPGPGSYAVVERGTEAGGRFWMRALLQDLEAAGPYAFRVDEGNVRVVSADSAWVEGRFKVEMVAHDTAFQIDTLTRTVRRLPTEWATLQGNFSAARAEPCAGLAAQQ